MRRLYFIDRFEREKFNGESDFYVFDRQGNISVDMKNRPILEKELRISGQPNILWLDQNGLLPASHPVPFMEEKIFRKPTPDEKKDGGIKQNSPYLIIGRTTST